MWYKLLTMHRKVILYALTVFLFLLSCTKDATIISKPYPVLQTFDVTSINSEGVTFNGAFIDPGYSEITDYGFVFYPVNQDTLLSDSVLITSTPINGNFSISISEGIAGNVNYEVKTFAKTEKNIVYGNKIPFTSQGSKYNPWNNVLNPKMDGWHDAHGISGNNLGFILFQSKSLYCFDPQTNSITQKQNIPVGGSTGTYYASFSIQNYIYVLTNSSGSILRYDIEKDSWSTLGPRPFSPNTYIGFYGFNINNVGYFIMYGNFYAYNESSDSWEKKPDIPSVYLYSAQVVGNKVYVFAENKTIWSYSPESDVWTEETQYPGEWNKKIVGFAQNNKLYWGLSYYGSYWLAPLPATDFWEYNPELKSWKQMAKFPLIHSQTEIFTFTIDSLLYFGYYDNGYSPGYEDYIMFSFDVSKSK